MINPATLSKNELLILLDEQAATLQSKDVELQSKDVELQQHLDVISQLQRQCHDLTLAYNILLQQRFASRSERYIADPDQLRLDFDDSDEAADAADGLADAVDEADIIPEHRRRKPRKRRDESLPQHLPRYEVTANVDDEDKQCPEHGERTLLPKAMWDRIETLEFERPQLKVRVTVYPKYACDNQPQCGVASPQRPAGVVEGDKYAPSVAAEIIVGKYGYHLPIYRQQDYFAGSGWTPGRSTLLNILSNSHHILLPVLAFFKTTLQNDSGSNGIVGCDDTGVTLLYPKTLPTFDLTDPQQRRIHEVFAKALEDGKSSISAKMWAYRGTNIPLNVFDFTVSRHRDGPELFFADYEGTLLGDCWHGFQSIASSSNDRIVRAACNAHARRKIEESQAHPVDRAKWLVWYQQLYDIEERGKAMSAEERLKLRQTEAAAVWSEMECELDRIPLRTKDVVLPKSDFYKALQYIRRHLSELKRYLSNADLPADNNETEQLMKQVAIGRKNWLFVGSVPAGERAAGFMTLVSSALRSDLDVWEYVKDVLEQLLGGETDYESLLPWNWAKQHPDAIRQYRQEERQDRRQRKTKNRYTRRQKNRPSK